MARRVGVARQGEVSVARQGGGGGCGNVARRGGERCAPGMRWVWCAGEEVGGGGMGVGLGGIQLSIDITV